MRMMKRSLMAGVALALACAPAAWSADDTLTSKNAAGTTITICSKDTGAGVMAACHAVVDTTGAKIDPMPKTGGTVGVLDGADNTLGAKADTAWTTGSGSVVALLKAMAAQALSATATTVEITKVNGSTVQTGSGAAAGTVRVEIANDGTGQVNTTAGGAAGSAVPTKVDYVGANSGGNLAGIIQADTSVKIDVATATTTQLVALSAGKKIYVTAWDVIAGGSGNIKLVYGTGTACATGTTDVTGAYSLVAQAGISKGSGLGPILIIPASQALCVTTSAAVQMSGSLAETQF